MADDSEADLRQWYAEAAAVPASDHLEEGVWEQLALGQLGGAERARAFEHVTECTECGAIYRELVLLRQEAVASGFPVPTPAGAAPRRRPLPWALAGLAAAAAALVIAVVSRPALRTAAPGSTPTPGLRSDHAAGASGGPFDWDADVVSPKGRLTSLPSAFHWEAVAGARAYRLELLRPNLEPIWSSGDVRGTSAPWPSDLRPAPGRYYWRVATVPTWSRSDADWVWSPLVPLELAAEPSPKSLR